MNSDRQLATRQSFSLVPQTLAEAVQFAELIADSDLVPAQFKGKPGNILVAIQMGLDLGLAPMQALQNIYIVNGRPTVWGDAMLALVKGHPDCEDVQEDDVETIKKNQRATCKVKRRGQAWVMRTFSKEDALKATLWNKSGPWKQYPERMLQMRARSWALRDSFPDALRGIQMREEAQDIPVEVVVEPGQLGEHSQFPEAERPDLQTVLDRIADCKSIPERDNVEAKYVTGNGWNEQEWGVLTRALDERSIAILKKLKDASKGDHGQNFTAATNLQQKIQRYADRVKARNSQYGATWFKILCEKHGGKEGVNGLTDIDKLEALLADVNKKGAELKAAQEKEEVPTVEAPDIEAIANDLSKATSVKYLKFKWKEILDNLAITKEQRKAVLSPAYGKRLAELESGDKTKQSEADVPF